MWRGGIKPLRDAPRGRRPYIDAMERLRRIGVLAVVLLTATLGLTNPAAAAAPVRIMVVGDSISHGSSGDYTWRYRLAKHLSAAGVSYDLVGLRNDLFDRPTNAHGSQSYVDPAFDRDHAAKWGEMIGAAKDRVATEVAATDAQILLVHLGINDLVWGGTAAAAELSLRSFIANARTGNPGIRILFGKVLFNETARDNAAVGQKVTDYNSRLVSVVGQLSTAASPLHVVDTPPGYEPTADAYDGTHLNPRGEYRLAAAYANGLSQFAGIGRAFGAIPSVPLLGAPASLTATAGDAAVRLQWSAVVGADSYYIWQRDVTAGQDWVRLPYPLAMTAWDAQLLTSGHTWEFRVQPLRGHDTGGFSPTAWATPTGSPPAAPTDLVAEPRDGEALLRWTAVSGATGYYVYQRNATANEAWVRLPYPLTGTQWTAGLLANGQRYEYRLTAANLNGESGFSNLASVTPVGPVPDPPDDLRAAPGNGEAVLSWRGSAGATGYIVYQRDVTAGSGWVRLPYPVPGPQWTAGLLANGHTYQYKLRAVSANGESGDSEVVSVTPTAPRPGTPTNLTASPGNGRALLSWTRSSDATGYLIHVRDVTAGEAFRQLPYPVPGPQWTAELLVNQHTYEFKIRATGPGGESGFSNTVTVRPVGPKPAVPTNLTATAGNSTARLCWRAASGADGYMIYVRDASAGEAWRRLPYPVSTTCWTAELLVNRHTYEFRVSAVNENGESGLSNVAAARPLAPPPTVPTLTATAGNGNTRLCWSNTNGNQFYIYVRDTDGDNVLHRLPYPVVGTCWTASALINEHRYNFRVTASDGDQESGLSNTVGATPHATWTVPAVGPISSPFHDPDRLPEIHNGTDIDGARHDPIVAAWTGTVVVARCFGDQESDCNRDGYRGSPAGCGWGVQILHDGGTVRTTYCHMQTRPYVTAGQRVFGGQQIGQEGSSGDSSGPHLHFAVSVNGNYVDPEPFMIGRGARLG
jgi:murein DD-endopeptidase MepM/ murein hydrolase activator NlpD